MPNIVVVTTKKVAIVAFIRGLMQTESWATRLMADYLLQLSDTPTAA